MEINIKELAEDSDLLVDGLFMLDVAKEDKELLDHMREYAQKINGALNYIKKSMEKERGINKNG